MALRAHPAADARATGSRPRRLPVVLQPPAKPGDHLERRRLLDRLDVALERRLTTIVAGPGYGKTTLVAEIVDPFRKL